VTTTKIAYDSVTDTNALTITLASLATSSSLLVGRESTVISNLSALYVDAMVMGQIMTGTSPTAGNINVWAYGINKLASSAASYPSPLTGSDAALTVVAETLTCDFALVQSIPTNTTSNQAYTLRPASIRELFGAMPLKWGIFVTHNTAVNLNSTAGNHWIHYSGITYTTA
jgi:hypothetical protein